MTPFYTWKPAIIFLHNILSAQDRLEHLEGELERKEAERMHTLLVKDMIDRDKLDEELLRIGCLIREKHRMEPVILLQRTREGKPVTPVFCMNPLKEEYYTCRVSIWRRSTKTRLIVEIILVNFWNLVPRALNWRTRKTKLFCLPQTIGRCLPWQWHFASRY